MNRRTCLSLLAGAFLLAATGCGGRTLYQATGRLTHKGQPVPSTYVVFLPQQEGQRPSRGLSDADGNFKLTNSRTETGVLPGKHKVYLEYYVAADEEMGTVKPRVPAEVKKLMSSKYNSEKTPLEFEVSKNGQVFEIAIE